MITDTYLIRMINNINQKNLSKVQDKPNFTGISAV
jgi:hypothetical protein